MIINYIAIGLLCFAFGLHISRFIDPSRRSLVRRLNNIYNITNELCDGLYEGHEKNVLIFILCESDLSVRDDDLESLSKTVEVLLRKIEETKKNGTQ